MASIPKTVYIDKLYEIVKKYKNTYHRTIKMEPVDVNLSMYIDFNKKNNDKDRKFRIDNIVQIIKTLL